MASHHCLPQWSCKYAIASSLTDGVNYEHTEEFDEHDEECLSDAKKIMLLVWVNGPDYIADFDPFEPRNGGWGVILVVASRRSERIRRACVKLRLIEDHDYKK